MVCNSFYYVHYILHVKWELEPSPVITFLHMSVFTWMSFLNHNPLWSRSRLGPQCFDIKLYKRNDETMVNAYVLKMLQWQLIGNNNNWRNVFLNLQPGCYLLDAQSIELEEILVSWMVWLGIFFAHQVSCWY